MNPANQSDEPVTAPPRRGSGVYYAGIDEAGYGPRLGPLCVAMAAFRVDPSQPNGPAPDLWRELASAVSRKPEPGRIAVADSKKLKLPNQSKRLHPLTHLELAVMAGLMAADRYETADLASDDALLRTLGCDVRCLPEWYQVPSTVTPQTTSAELLRLRAHSLERALARAGASLERIRIEVIDETRFNRMLGEREGRSKARVSFDAVGRLLGTIFEEAPASDDDRDAPRVVLDRQGGRIRYIEELERTLPGSRIHITHECPTTSRYLVESERADETGRRKRMVVTVRVSAEEAHLPVALSSMAAKLAREMLMHRFNTYWRSRAGESELKPTAGYGLDARRWLDDATHLCSAQQRKLLWRRA